MNLTDAIVGPAVRAALKAFNADVTYQAQGALAPSPLRCFMRRLNPQELLAAAIQQGALMVIDTEQFQTVIGNATPRLYDRVVVNGITSYAVERWDSSPIVGPPVLFKITLLGGQQ
jgi:hypothetical protein